MRHVTLGLVDTMFARADLGHYARVAIEEEFERVTIVHRTVPGMKDLPVACKILLEEEGCEICVALAMPGDDPKDKVCAHEAAQGLMLAQLMTNRHILEVFVHADEADDPDALLEICANRARDHAVNAVLLVAAPERIRMRRGQGVRQGTGDAGPIRTEW